MDLLVRPMYSIYLKCLVVTVSTIKFKHEIIAFFHKFCLCVSRECEIKKLGLLYPYTELADSIFLAGTYNVLCEVRTGCLFIM